MTDPPSPPTDPPSPPQPPPPRAFTQGVGTVYQFVGVSLFVLSMLVCCGSSLVSKNVAERPDLMAVGWALPLPGGPFFYSAQRAITISLLLAVFFGIALAGLGLGLQAQSRRAPSGAVLVAGFATLFWAAQAVFFAQTLGSVPLAAGTALLAIAFGILAAFAVAAAREMRLHPPPPDHEVLPADYKVPYSHLHQDPPEVRLARDLEQRRERLAVQQKELEMLEARLKRKLEARPPDAE
jgi:hypothetical protein